MHRERLDFPPMPTCSIPETNDSDPKSAVSSLRCGVALARQPQVSNFSSIPLMQTLLAPLRVLYSPAILIIVVWCTALILVAIGPVDYHGQPSLAVLTIVASGLALFNLAYWAGELWFRLLTRRRTNLSAPGPARPQFCRRGRFSCRHRRDRAYRVRSHRLEQCQQHPICGTSALCADLVNAIRNPADTPALSRVPYHFSFGFAFARALFLLKGEQIRGWIAVLAQLSILSPIGYAVIYSGRTSVLLIIGMFFSVMIVRLAQGHSALPQGHHLFIKLSALVVVFAIYSSANWSTRREYCV